jgi:hypothetical protein
MSRWVLLGIVIFLFAGILATPKWSSEQKQAIEIGREYLEDVGREPGKVLSVELVQRDEVSDGHLFYWQRAKGLDVPDVPEPEWCWVVRFESGYFPGHWFEVLIDADTGGVTGYASCR